MKRWIVFILSIAFCIAPFSDIGVKAETIDGSNEKISEIIINDDYVSDEDKDTVIADIKASAKKIIVKSSAQISSENELVNYIREQLKKRNESISVEFMADNMSSWNGDASGYFDVVMDKVIEETDDPYGGDYITRHILAYEMSGQITTDRYGKVKIRYNISASFLSTASQEDQVKNYVDNKTSELGLKSNTKSNIEKLKAIYDCVRTNNTYDYNAANADDSQIADYYYSYTAYGAAIVGRSVCQGYSSLVYALCKTAGIPVRFVNSNEHGWNIVSIDGGKSYYNIDATWDDTGDDILKHKYFLKSDDDIKIGNTSHNKTYEFNTASFKNSYPMAKYSYYNYEITEDKHIGRCAYNNEIEVDENHKWVTVNGDTYCDKCGYGRNQDIEVTTKNDNNLNDNDHDIYELLNDTSDKNDSVDVIKKEIQGKKASISKVSRVSKTKIKLSIKKIKGVSKYQIQIAKSKKFKKKQIVFKKTVGTKAVIKSKKLKTKKLFIRCRGYYKSDGKIYYSAWSKSKKI